MCWRSRGVTLVESLLGVALAAICVALALPSWRAALQAQRVRAAAAALRDGLQLARMQSLLGAVAVRVCPGAGCGAPARWEQGWVVQVEAAAGGAARLLAVQAALPGVRIDSTAALRDGAAFDPGGWPRQRGGALLMGVWRICPRPAVARVGGRELVLAAGGRLREREVREVDCPAAAPGRSEAAQRWLRVLPTSLAVMSTMRIIRS